MTTIPHYTSTTITGRRVLMDNLIDPEIEAIVLSSDNADSGSTPTHRFRDGNVVVLRTSTGEYVEADDSNADAPTPAIVSASETADAGWQSSTITVTLNGGIGFSVTLGATDNTDAKVVTALNGDAVFAANCIADVNATLVRIRTLEAGEDVYLHVTSDLTTAYGANGQADTGADPDVRVTLAKADLQNQEGTAVDAEVIAARSGHFDESNLIVGGSAASATSQHWVEARAVLTKRGAKFS